MRLAALTQATPQLMAWVRTLVERAPLPMVATEGPTHIVRYVNKAFTTLVGRAAEDVVGSPLNAPAHDSAWAQDDAGQALLDLVLETGTPEFALDLARVYGHSNTIHLPFVVWPILGDDDRPSGLLLQVSAPASDAAREQIESGTAEELRDVNERLLVAGLRAQEQAELQITLRGEAEAALTVRDEFISIAAHELRTPLTGIKTSAQLALRTVEDEPLDKARTVRYLLGIESGANRLELLVNDLMDVSRMRSGNLLLRVTPIDLGPLVTAVVQRYAEIGGERYRLTTDLPVAPLVVAGDAGRLEQILDNLLSNAVKYSPGGGEIAVSLRPAGDGVVLTVSDTGIGLTAGMQERIFEPFGRAPNAQRQGVPGMGLGLHICRWIAEAHRGRMWAESAGEGQGMSVSLWLPRP
jgi:signal transduction histidine kinase